MQLISGDMASNFIVSSHTHNVMNKAYGITKYRNNTVTYSTYVLDDLLLLPRFQGIGKAFIKVDVEGYMNTNSFKEPTRFSTTFI